MDSTVDITESQVDWLTATALTDVPVTRLTKLATALTADERRAGNAIAKWGHQGYKGYHCGHLEWGIRGDSAIIRLWGKLADERLDDVREASDHFTRVDLAVTTRVEPFNEELAKEKKGELEQRERGRGFQAGWDFRETSRHGDTLYIGSRSSQFYARLYNKQRELDIPAYKSCWRWEVECKQAAAGNAVAALTRFPDRQSYIRSAVHQHFSRRGVQPIWHADGDALQGAGDAGEPDLKRHARWVERAIRPMLDKYRRTPGYELLLKALGVPDELAAQAAAAAELSDEVP